MKNLWRYLSTLGSVAVFALAGCGGGGDGNTTAGGQGGADAGGGGEIVIGIVAKSVSNPVFVAAHQGAKDAAAELSSSTGKKITVNILTPPDEDPTKQSEAIDTLVRQGAAAIAVSCSNADTVTPAINRAIEKGIPVMCFDSDAPNSKRICYYGTDDAAAGREVMASLAKEMGGKGTIAILAGNEAAPNLRRRVEAVREELKKTPEIKEITSGAVYHEEIPAASAQKLQEVQRANPNINGWALVGGWPLFTRDALPWQPGQVKLVSVDALPDQISYLKSGHVNLLLAQDCYGWGHKSVSILVDKVVNKKDPQQQIIIDPLARVTKDNADEWMKNWDKWLKAN